MHSFHLQDRILAPCLLEDWLSTPCHLQDRILAPCLLEDWLSTPCHLQDRILAPCHTNRTDSWHLVTHWSESWHPFHLQDRILPSCYLQDRILAPFRSQDRNLVAPCHPNRTDFCHLVTQNILASCHLWD